MNEIKYKTIIPVKIGKLKPSPELLEIQELMPIGTDDRERLKSDMKESGEIRDPIKVYRSISYYYIIGGFNRWEIAKELGWKQVPVEIIDIKGRDNIRNLCIKDNLSRRQLSQEQKRNLIEAILKEDPSVSNKSIAKNLSTTKETVKKVRQALESGGEIRPLESRKGADGKEYAVREQLKQEIKPKDNIKSSDNNHLKEEPVVKYKLTIDDRIIMNKYQDAAADLFKSRNILKILSVEEQNVLSGIIDKFYDVRDDLD